jgi:hypothetical protein
MKHKKARKDYYSSIRRHQLRARGICFLCYLPLKEEDGDKLAHSACYREKCNQQRRIKRMEKANANRECEVPNLRRTND